MNKTNCVNCGAPITAYEQSCSYCGTFVSFVEPEQYNVTSIDVTGKKYVRDDVSCIAFASDYRPKNKKTLKQWTNQKNKQ
jgi:predicted ATP-dependent serine protease